ncbi:RNA-binding ribosome biosynthesis protein mak21, partial [Coemansia aciculifera]
ITKDNDEAEAEAANDEADSDSEKARKASAAAAAAGKKGAPKKVYIGQKALLKAKEDAEKKRAEEERSMDNKLLAAILTGLNRALPFSKMEDEVMDKHIGVIFQVAHAGNFNTVVQSLVLLNQVVRMRPGIGDRFYRTLYDSLLDPRLDSTSKKAMYLNVLFRALKADCDMPRVMAFIKRIMQVCLYNQAEFVSGALFLVSQILSLNPQIYTMLTQPEDNDEDEDDGAKADADSKKYDAQKRDPRYAHAETSCMWETTLLMRHFHPSVTHSIKQIFDGEQVPAINNLHNHSLTHFLDRFVFRKPKGEEGGSGDMDEGIGAVAAPTSAKSSTLRGQSIMQPVIQKDGPDMELGPNRTRVAAGDYLIASKRTGGVMGGLDLTLDSIADLQKSDVPPDEQFFHQFFQTKKARMGKKVKKTKRSAGADDDAGFAGAVQDDDELDEDEVWQAMTSSMPKAPKDDEADMGDLEANGDDDDDLLAALREDESDEDEDEGASDDESPDAEDSDEDEDDEDDDDSDSDMDGFPGFDDEISDAELDVDEQAEVAASQSELLPLGTKRKSKGIAEEPKASSSSSSKRKKSEKMPLFGSFDDYAHLIDNDEGL